MACFADRGVCARWLKKILVLFFAFANALQPFAASADSYSWVQSGWSGGSSLDGATHPTDDTGWSRYRTASRVTTSSVATFDSGGGQGSEILTTDADFGAGTHNRTIVSASGEPSVVNLDEQTVNILPSIDMGRYFSCAVTQDGNVWCWGYNYYKQLGDGTTTNRTSAAKVVGPGGSGFLSGVTQVSAGREHACAVKSDNTLWCWGNNNYGELGDNSGMSQSAPVQVVGVGGSGFLTGVEKVSTAEYRTCALKTNGTVYCWGYIGSYNSSPTPVQVPGEGGVGSLSNAQDIAIGNQHSCALVSGGNVYCWGSNDWYGQLGDNYAESSSDNPVKVHGVGDVGYLGGIVEIVTGSSHTCARDGEGKVYCWGDGGSGQIGDNSSSSRYYPVQPQGPGGWGTTLTTAMSISAGENNTCAIVVGGELYCWGAVSGYYRPDPSSNKLAGTEAGAVSPGYDQICALKNDGDMYCWGANDYGQLGDGSTTWNSDAVHVKERTGTSYFTDVAEIRVGGAIYYPFSCVRKTDGTVWCWGNNNQGVVGDNTRYNLMAFPVQVHGPGNAGYLTDVAQIATGYWHVCALKTDGTVWCWGSNDYGQIGDNTTNHSNTPIQVHGVGNIGFLTDIVQITADEYSSYTCARSSGGNVYCWGSNGSGKLGDNTTTNRLVPVQVHGVGNVGFLTGVSHIDAGADQTCATKSDGSAYCWGSGYYGGLGIGTIGSPYYRYTPVQVHGEGDSGFLQNVTATSSSGFAFSCALKSGGTVSCWGYNDAGQLGFGSNSPSSRAYPTAVSTITGITQLESGYSSSCARKNDGSAWCWGGNWLSTIGDGTDDDRYSPVQVHGVGDVGYLSDVSQVAIGGHACAITSSGSAYCWGNWTGSSHQFLGDGTFTGSNTPVQVVSSFTFSNFNTGVLGTSNQYASLGTFVSPTIDFGSAITPETFSFATTEGAGTDVRFQIAANNDNASWDTFEGPGPSSDTYITTSGTNVSSTYDNEYDGYRYYRVKAFLSSVDGVNTPSLESFTLNYSLPVGSGDLRSSVFDTNDGAGAPTGLSWSQDEPSGTTVQFQLRTSADGASWTPWSGPTGSSSYFDDPSGGASLPSNLSDGTNDRYVQYRAELSTTNASNPSISNVTINFNSSSGPVNSAPSTPSSLGPANLTDGSQSSDDTPTLQFTQSDPNSGDQLKYRIQIDDTSDFSSPSVDYSSGLGSQGAASFTVGQAPGTGTYATGSQGQTLPVGSYYWRVMSTDNGELSSGYAVANGGSIAFEVVSPLQVTGVADGRTYITTVTPVITGGIGTVTTTLNSNTYVSSTPVGTDGTYVLVAQDDERTITVNFEVITSIIIPDPEPSDIYSSEYKGLSTVTGTADEATMAVVNIPHTIVRSGSSAFFPTGTEMTKVGGGEFAFSALDIVDIAQSVRNERPGAFIGGAISLGVPNIRMNFSLPLTVRINIDPRYDGYSLLVTSRSAGETEWTEETTCLVTADRCTFQTTHATDFAAGIGPLTVDEPTDITLDINATISLSCDPSVTMNALVGTGKSTIDNNNQADCTVTTNNSGGYKMEWQASADDMLSGLGDRFAAYSPAATDTPETWDIAATSSAWGAKIAATSEGYNGGSGGSGYTYPGLGWGSDDSYANGKFLNVASALPFQIMQKSTETDVDGETQSVMFTAEIGADKLQPTGTYTVNVTITATTM